MVTVSPRRGLRLVGETLLSLLALGGLVCLALVVAAVVFRVTIIMFATGSMSPAIPAGSIAFVREIPATEMTVGDVVTVSRDPELPITHRVVEIESVDGERVTFRMKGDANAAEDPVPYTATTVRHVWWAIPGVAAGVAWLQQPLVLAAVTIGAAILVTWAFWPRREEGDEASMGEGDTRPRRRSRARGQSRAGEGGGDETTAGDQSLTSATTSPNSVSPTGVNPTRRKNASGPSSPAS
ncbi:signal peptidase I [Microbacterium sp.]|uniref:signal peptidase I n=1 Tax=Microbacterium sp. TaxID=51671 RepID=UPI0039E24A86